MNDNRQSPMPGQALAHADFEATKRDGDYSNEHTMVGANLDQANLITSIVSDGAISLLGGHFTQHKVVIDVDMPAQLIESSTPGHFHLLIDKAMSWDQYIHLLQALVNAGIVEPGYLAAAERRGHTAVRLPWVRKPAPVAHD